MSYRRLGWRQVREGDVLKDPRGDRTLAYADRWGYRLEPDPRHPYEFMRPWPRVGRLKVRGPE